VPVPGKSASVKKSGQKSFQFEKENNFLKAASGRYLCQLQKLFVFPNTFVIHHFIYYKNKITFIFVWKKKFLKIAIYTGPFVGKQNC
jgi:hypothetical protein